MNKLNIVCPNCSTEISVDQAITNELAKDLKTTYAQALKKKEQDLEKQYKERQLKETASRQADIEKALQEEKEKTAKTLLLLQEDIQNKTAKLQEAEKIEIEIRKEKNKLEEDKRSFELEKQRQLDQERLKIKEEAAKTIEAEFKQKLAEKDKQLKDALHANEEQKRKLEQGSQQTQGEVLELELESILKNTFPLDTIEPVAKGITGADIIQTVFDRQGRKCGSIIWELKSTKAWSPQWITKLKDDQRTIKAEVSVLITKTLPENIATFGDVEGVWVSNFECAIPLAQTLRSHLLSTINIKTANSGKNEKMEAVYNYLSGSEFRQRIEAITESFITMKKELDTEKRAMQKIWSSREKQIERVITSTTGVYGDLQGLSGNSILPIQSLELDASSEEVKEISSTSLFA